MELFLLLSLGFCLFFVLQALVRSSWTCGHKKLPPSPPSLPIIGHLHLIGKFPHRSMMELAKSYGGLMFLKLGSLNSVVVSSPAAAELVLKTSDPAFAWKPKHLEAKYLGYDGAGLIFGQYGEHWRQVRKLCTLELLSSKRVDMARPNRRLEMNLLLRDLFVAAKQGIVTDLTAKLSDFTFNVMIKMVSNKSYSKSSSSKAEEQQAIGLKDGIIDIVKIGNGMHIASFFPWLKWIDKQVYKMRAVHKVTDKILQEEVDEHRKAFKEGQVPKDFIDVMLAMNGLSNNTIKSLTADMLAASTDTGSITAEWAISELLKHPQALNKALAELDEVIGSERTMDESDIQKLKYLQAIVNETLRLHPPVPIYPRENSQEECTIGEYTVPGRTRVFINAYAIGRDESVWKRALLFDPERFLQQNAIDARGQDFELIPFGAGRRMCPGMNLGLTNVMLMVGSLLHAFDWSLANGDLDMAEHFGMTVCKATPLQLLPAPRLLPSAYE